MKIKVAKWGTPKQSNKKNIGGAKVVPTTF
jgi:hypothetical protein